MSKNVECKLWKSLKKSIENVKNDKYAENVKIVTNVTYLTGWPRSAEVDYNNHHSTHKIPNIEK